MVNKLLITTIGGLLLASNINASIISKTDSIQFKQEQQKKIELERKSEILEHQKELKNISAKRYSNMYGTIIRETHIWKIMPKNTNNIETYNLMILIYDGILSKNDKDAKKFIKKYLTKDLMEKFLNPTYKQYVLIDGYRIFEFPLTNYMIKQLGGKKYVMEQLKKDTTRGLFISLKNYSNNSIFQKEIINLLNRIIKLPHSKQRKEFYNFFKGKTFENTYKLIDNEEFKNQIEPKILTFLDGPKLSKEQLSKLSDTEREINLLSNDDLNYYKYLINNYGKFPIFNENIKIIRLYSKDYPLFISLRLSDRGTYNLSSDIELFVNYAAFIKQNYKNINIDNLYVYYIRVLTYKNSDGIGFDTKGIKQLLEFNSDFKDRLKAVVSYHLLGKVSDKYKKYLSAIKDKNIVVYNYDINSVKQLSEKSNKGMLNQTAIINRINKLAKNHTFKQTDRDKKHIYYRKYI